MAQSLACPQCSRSLDGVPVVQGRIECPGCGALCALAQPAPRPTMRVPPPVTTDSGPATSGPSSPGRPAIPKNNPLKVSSPGAAPPDDTIDAFNPSLGTSLTPLPPNWVPPFSKHFLESYKVEGLLGKGAMGAVYLMRQVKLDRLVAVKVVREEVLSPDEAKRLEKEARVLASLNHPNILALYDVGTDQGMPFMVCEYVEGETLSARMQRQPPLTLMQTLRIILQVLDGLKAAHKKNIIHRDLKPGNILLSGSGRPKIGDFGLAKSHALSSGTLAGRIVGTPPYMSPEQCRGGTTTVSSDIYSMGCILFELAAGRRPFTGPETLDYLTQHTMDPPPHIREVNPQMPEALELILLKALQKDPGRRYDSARTFRKELLELYKQLTPAPVPELIPEPELPPLQIPAQIKRASGIITSGDVLGGRYKVTRLLGEGGMGQVWHANDAAMDGTEVAVKVLPGDLWRDAEARETLKMEAKLSQKLSHPNIVRLMTLEPGEPSFLVMEYIAGPTLAADLGNRKRKGLGPYTPQEALPLIEGLAAGLDHAHSKNLIHRDLKPSNMMLDPQADGSYVAKLADFGIAAEITNYRTRQTGAVPAGTLAYMSPEQLACQKLDARADVYSLGATLYQMLTLAPPYVGGDIAWAIKNEPVPEPDNVPAPVIAVLNAALAKKRDARPSTAGELALRLREAVQHAPVSRPPIGDRVPLDASWAEDERSRASAIHKRPTLRVNTRGDAYSRVAGPEMSPPLTPSAAAIPAAQPLQPWSLEAYALGLCFGGGVFTLWLHAAYQADNQLGPARVAIQLVLSLAVVLGLAAQLWAGNETVRKVLIALHALLIPAGLGFHLVGRPELAAVDIAVAGLGLFLLCRPAVRAYCTQVRDESLDLPAHHSRRWALGAAPLVVVATACALRSQLAWLPPEYLPSAIWMQSALGERTTSPDRSFTVRQPLGWAIKNAADSLGFVYNVGLNPVAALALHRGAVRGEAGLVDVAGASARLAARRKRFHVEIERAGVANIDGHLWVECEGRFRAQSGPRAIRYLETVRGGSRYELEFYGVASFVQANRQLASAVAASLDEIDTRPVPAPSAVESPAGPGAPAPGTPDHTEWTSLIQKGDQALVAKDPLVALRHFDMAQRIGADAALHLRRARCLVQLGSERRPEARQALQAALSLDPSNASARADLKNLD